MNTVVINGVAITGGRNITIHNGKVIVDGVDVTPDAKSINISVNGNVDRIDADACQKIDVSGDTQNITTVSGDVEVRGKILGSVQTVSGNVNCAGPIGGGVSTLSGNIRSR